MMISAIAAMADNRVIGLHNKLPWHKPEDMKFFREKTKNSILIMGRKTLESLPGLLPGRFHLVISRDSNYQPPFEVNSNFYQTVTSVEQAVTSAKELLKAHPHFKDEVFILNKLLLRIHRFRHFCCFINDNEI